ncbi:MAG: translocation/assembly module TamB domain-containing protein [Bryobacterales bacterium]|nr:translocation/assembly module TamB domain-containing protein [Bryobacterales bacterium]
MPRRTGLPARFGLLAGIAAGLALAALLFAVIVSQSDWFRGMLRDRAVAEVEKALGGRASLGGLRFDWLSGTFEVRDFVLRGTEPDGAPDLLRLPLVRAGIRITSLTARGIDLATLTVDRPELNLIVNADGSTNWPEPAVRGPRRDLMETILNLRVGRFSIADGAFTVNETRRPLAVRGQRLAVLFRYAPDPRRYEGEVAADPVEISWAGRNIGIKLDSVLRVEQNRVDIGRTLLVWEGSRLELEGTTGPLNALDARLRIDSDWLLPAAVPLLGLKNFQDGHAILRGDLEVRGPDDYAFRGTLDVRELVLREASFRIGGVACSGRVEAVPGRIAVDGFSASMAGGAFQGRVRVDDFRRFDVEGDYRGFEVPRILDLFDPPLPGDVVVRTIGAVASGPVRVRGAFDGSEITVESDAALENAEGQIGVSGHVPVRYVHTRAGHSVAIGSARVQTPASIVEFSGSLDDGIGFEISTPSLPDLAPAVRALWEDMPEPVPLALDGGMAVVTGRVTNLRDRIRVAGQLSATRLVWNGLTASRLATDWSWDADRVEVRGATLFVEGTEVHADGGLALTGWVTEDASEVALRATVRSPEFGPLWRAATGRADAVSGELNLSARLSGTLADPRAEGQVLLANGLLFDEPVDRLQTGFRWASRRATAPDLRITLSAGEIAGSVEFDHPAGNPRSGDLTVRLAAPALEVGEINAVRARFPSLGAPASVDASFAVRFANIGEDSARVQITAVNGRTEAPAITLDGAEAGSLLLTSATKGGEAELAVRGALWGAPVETSAAVRLEAGYPMRLNGTVGTTDLARLLRAAASEDARFRFGGNAEASFALEGPALDFARWQGRVTIPKFEIFPEPDNGEAPAESLKLRNSGALLLNLRQSALVVERLQLVGAGTDLAAKGSLALTGRQALDFEIAGGLNLAALGRISDEVTSTGNLDLRVAVRGVARQPQINGRVELKDANFELVDTPGGLFNVEGVVVFSGLEATIQKLRGEAGGGTVTATGFADLSGGLPSFRVEVKADQVRVRYPEGVSTSSSATLTLSGTTRNSLLAGTVTILKASFQPQSDIASIFTKGPDPVRTPAAQEGLLSGLQFDIRVETTPNLSFESSVAKDVRADGSFTLRGSAYNPVLLGRMHLTQGEVNFFGTRYQIQQGTVSFVNPARVEPILNLDLETRVRGIDVILTFAGPINKLTLTHRADPPLEFSEVVALLATGRAPTSDPALLQQQSSQYQNYGQLGATAILGQAVAAPISNRLQRLFGVSRLKIDPNLIGVENIPRARVTLEQQLSKDITFTFVTDVTRANQQIVQMEWVVSRQWSVIAIRDENGLFGVDFLYRRGFK